MIIRPTNSGSSSKSGSSKDASAEKSTKNSKDSDQVSLQEFNSKADLQSPSSTSRTSRSGSQNNNVEESTTEDKTPAVSEDKTPAVSEDKTPVVSEDKTPVVSEDKTPVVSDDKNSLSLNAQQILQRASANKELMSRLKPEQQAFVRERSQELDIAPQSETNNNAPTSQSATKSDPTISEGSTTLGEQNSVKGLSLEAQRILQRASAEESVLSRLSPEQRAFVTEQAVDNGVKSDDNSEQESI